jgi:outer membrane protein, multidrug efflux system
MRFEIAHVAFAFIGVMLMVLAGGCALGPDYRRPIVDVPEVTRGQTTALEAESIADLGWWEMFGDPVLSDLVENALARNHDLAAAAARVDQARQLVRVARADIFPQLDVRTEAVRQRGDTAAGRDEFNAFLGAANLAWEIDLWGRIRRLTEAATAEFWAAEDVRRGVLLSLAADVASNYFELLSLDSELAIANESVRTTRETRDLFENRFEGGIANLLEVSRARAQVAEAEAQVPDLQRQIVARENQISILAGRLPGPVERGESLARRSVHANVPVGLPSDLLERRPDLLQAEHAIVAANAEAGAALASFFPRLGLTALYGAQSTELDQLLKHGSNIWSVGGAVTAPLFQGGRLLATYRARNAVLDEAIERYAQATLRAFAEVSSLLVAHDRLRGVRIKRQEMADQLRISVDLSLQRYRDGIASYFEVLEAQQQYFPAERNLVRTERDQLVTIVDLYRALGGGWKL